uniref:Synaptobrevin, longin-like domain protein n=1 Tax=Tanacetum cinerariifolium TaxID=118510 RepID=A0A6L2MZA1_TANCI|nr:hypothetical protein [Tanacetum cinerariifolium]
MARLQFCDYHIMVIILEKSEHNADFHPMVDFIKASPLRIETTEVGTQILATVDGIHRTVTKSSLRRNLKLQDKEGISSLPDTELFKSLTLMGYNISPNQKFIFQKGQFSHQWKIVPLFYTMLVQQVEGSGTPTEPHHTSTLEAPSQSHTTHTSPTLPPVTTTSILTVTPSDTPIVRQYTRRTRIAQSSVLPTIADEPTSPLRDVSQGEACLTDSSFIADQDRATIDKSSTLPYDSAPRVTSPVADEGKINRLKERLKMLEDREGVAALRSKDDAPIKGRSMDEGEAATERISDNSEEMEIVLISMDAVIILASRVVDVTTGNGSIPTASTPAEEQVPTGSGSIPTASTEEQVPTGSDVVPTASLVFATATVVTPYRRRKGKEVMVESEIPKKQKVQEQIDAQEYHQFASELPIKRRIELITDLVKYQDNYAKIYKFQSQQRKPWTKKKKRDYYMAVIRSNLGWKVKDFRGMSFEEVESKFNLVWKQMEDFIPMGSKEEAERIKRKGLSLEQESAKKQKTSEEVTKEAKSSDGVPEEKVKEMMQPVPIEEVYVEALQVKHPIIDWMVYTEGQRSYWKITRLGGNSSSYQFFIDLLKHRGREDFNQLWGLVKETLSNIPPISDKDMELWVELSRLYEPDNEDQLWTHTQNFMHALIEWKLYDTCGVHHVTSKDKEIFMLVEKDYPLRKGLALMMISYKLQVENYLQMANDLNLKIYKIANSPRQQGD